MEKKELRVGFKAYRALSEKLEKENIDLKWVLNSLMNHKNATLIHRESMRWCTKEGAISHAYPSMNPAHLVEEKLGNISTVWAEAGDYASVCVEPSVETK